MEGERSLTTCMCKAGKNVGDICFMATGFNLEKGTVSTIDVFISVNKIDILMTAEGIKLNSINLVHHISNNIPIRKIVPFEPINVKGASTFRDGVLNIFEDLIKHQPVIRDNILKQLEILLKSDTTIREKLLVIDFLRGLDTFKYGKDTTSRFHTRCAVLLTCIITFLDGYFISDKIDTFDMNEDMIIEVLIAKSREKTNKKDISSPRLIQISPRNSSSSVLPQLFPDASKE